MIFGQTDILERIKERPFTPFRIHTSSGRSHEVRHPEVVFVNPHFVFLGIPVRDDDIHAIQEFVKVAFAHITEIEPGGMPVETAVEDNGGDVSV